MANDRSRRFDRSKHIAPDEITVQDGHLTMRLSQTDDGWYAVVDSAYEGKIFEGHVTDLAELMAGNVPQLDDRGDDSPS